MSAHCWVSNVFCLLLWLQVAVNAAELARSLPAQLRLALAPTTPRGISPAVGAAAARVTVRKLIKQKSSGTLGAIAAAGVPGTATSGSGQITSGSGAAGVSQRGRPASDQGAVSAGVLQRNRAGSDQGVLHASGGSGGVVGAVSASLAAAAAAVTGGVVGRSRGEKQPLLPGTSNSSAPIG